MADRFRYLNYGLGAILAFVGMKMLIADLYHVPTWASLAVISGALAVSIVASLRAERSDALIAHPDAPAADGPDLVESRREP
jgi:tellurite resistance protein TerC